MKPRGNSGSALFVIGLVLLLVSWFWLMPTVRAKMSDLEAKKSDRAALETRVEELNQLVSALALTPGEAGALPISYDDLQQSLPPARLVEDLYAMIEKVANDLGMGSDVTINVGGDAAEATTAAAATDADTTAVASSTLIELPVQISAKTSYDGAKQLLDRLTVTIRPLAVNTVSLAPQEDGSIGVTIGATAYTRSAEVATNQITQ